MNTIDGPGFRQFRSAYAVRIFFFVFGIHFRFSTKRLVIMNPGNTESEKDKQISRILLLILQYLSIIAGFQQMG
jgi:hypothetical protein